MALPIWHYRAKQEILFFMKITFAGRRVRGGAVSLGILLILSQSALSQTNIFFTSVNATDEGNIHLAWSSVSNEVYQIQEADTLQNTNSGAITWNLLYDGYPSQGTNTFWLDTGNYNLVPQILNPKKMPMRFYRIVDEGPDSLAGDEPIVTVNSPSATSAATGELTVTVTAATDQPVILGTKLYVDGQEMLPPDSTTNFTTGSTNYEQDTYSINTCEWPNETHTLFATAESASGYGDTVGSGPILTGHAVSPFVPILFSNLITKISFSQPQFNPSLGETQQVTANFAANCDWTLQIENFQNSNVVLTVTGGGVSMAYNWDGTGTGETNLPAGIYLYFISAETNGEALPLMGGGGSGGGGGSPPAPDPFMVAVPELWAVPPVGDGAVPLALYPPGFDTNGFTIFSASPSEMSTLSSFSFMGSAAGFYPASTGGSSSAAQNSPASPQRPPSNPVSAYGATFAIGYDTYNGNGTNGLSFLPIPNQPGIPGSYISLENWPANQSVPPYRPLLEYKAEANNFVSEMQRCGWKCVFNNPDSQFSLSSMIGSGTPFNSVNLGVMMTHGMYGTTADYMAGLCKQMYFPITSGNQYLRMSQMNLGGSGTGGLKWFAVMACNSLYQPNWNSMQSHGIHPYNNNLHLLLGTGTTSYTSRTLMEHWAQYMNVGVKGGFAEFKPLTVQNAWYQAATDAYLNQSFTNTTIVFAVAGDSACMNDYVFPGYNSSPGGSWTYSSEPVWTHP
jgi:hypothetical protein